VLRLRILKLHETIVFWLRSARVKVQIEGFHETEDIVSLSRTEVSFPLTKLLLCLGLYLVHSSPVYFNCLPHGQRDFRIQSRSHTLEFSFRLGK
jgi:hypothetical protein